MSLKARAYLLCGAVAAGLVLAGAGLKAAPTSPESPPGYGAVAEAPVLPPPPVASADEPFAKALSAQKAAEYLDTVGVNWVHQNKCGTCHTSYAYMMGRPVLGKVTSPALEQEVRTFFDQRVAERSSRPALPHALILAAVLSINDAEHHQGLMPSTREALDRVWELQGDDGAWEYPKVFYSPPLGDPYYGAVMAAIGVGQAPDHYADTPQAREGMARLRRWLASHKAPSLHHKTMLLWASLKEPALMTRADRKATIAELLALQHPDGGWALPALGAWNRRDGGANDIHAPSDGYATGLVVYVLHQAGLGVRDPVIARGVAWLKSNQRESGRWFTKSINTDDKGHLISNIGTAFAVMALASCGGFDEHPAVASR